MKSLIALSCMFSLILASCNKQDKPISLHPENPHYFLFRGKPTVLIGSTEHYGAVLNLDFDYVKYFVELESKGLNVTRTFTGIYLEPEGAFGIAKNTLAPRSGKFICPWARSEEPGYIGGGNKFDLNTWDENYFVRLKDFVAEAGKRNIVVELDLFSNIYDTIQWKLSPLHYSNNINQVEIIDDHKEILSLRHPDILVIQEKMVEKILIELNEFDNLYYEICNEPYFGDVAALQAWQQHMSDVVADIEEKLPVKHLISQNIANGFQKIEHPHPAVSIFNFHYAKPPKAVELNWELNKPIGDNETGFDGIEDVRYRTEAWDFMVAGGALFNNLDYSFTTESEDGTFEITPGQPGGGGVALRNQLKWLKETFEELNFIQMKPSDSLIENLSSGFSSVRMLAEEGKQYLLYINNTRSVNTNYSLRYKGEISVPVSGEYMFYTISDDGVRLNINNHPAINNWTNHATIIDSASVVLEANRKYSFELAYFQGGGGATLALDWKIPGKEIEPVPISAFSVLETSMPGLRVERFDDIELGNKVTEMVVTKIDAVGMAYQAPNFVNASVISISIPAGHYSGQWIDTKTGVHTSFNVDDHPGGILELPVPEFREDIALIIKK